MKKILFLFLCFSVALVARSQELGFIGGPQMCHGVVAAADDKASFGSIPGGGLHLGMLFEMNLSSRWGFDVAAMYEYRVMRWNLNYQDVDITTRMRRELGYLNVPFHLFVDFPLNDNYALSLFGGPVFTCGLHAADRAWQMTDLRKPVTQANEKMFDKESGRVVRCEIAAEIGLALKWKRFQGRVSYQHGINNANKKYLFTMLERNSKAYFTQGELKLSLAYLFDLRK